MLVSLEIAAPFFGDVKTYRIILNSSLAGRWSLEANLPLFLLMIFHRNINVPVNVFCQKVLMCSSLFRWQDKGFGPGPKGQQKIDLNTADLGSAWSLILFETQSGFDVGPSFALQHSCSRWQVEEGFFR